MITLSMHNHMLYLCLGIVILILASVVLCRVADVESDVDTITYLIEQVETKRRMLRDRFSEIDLLSSTEFQQSVTSFDRARLLVAKNNFSVAIPHAQSALALLEDTKRAIYQSRFQSLKSSILDLQISLIDFPSSDKLVTEAEREFRTALAEYERGSWENALDKLKQSQRLYQRTTEALKSLATD